MQAPTDSNLRPVRRDGLPPARKLETRAFHIFRQSVLSAFSSLDVLPDTYLLYTFEMLHASVVTSFHFNRGKPAGSEAACEREWALLLSDAMEDPAWPCGPGEVRVVGARLDRGGAGILELEDASGHMERMRACLRAAADRPRSPPFAHVRLSVPKIYHITVLRWRSCAGLADGMSEAQFAALCDAFRDGWADAGDVSVTVRHLATIRERLPYMYPPSKGQEKTPVFVKFTEL